jgi:hypothetical protein
MFFYHAGNVGLNGSDLSPVNWRQDAGIGIFGKFAGNIAAGTYWAWGAGHGAHWGYSLNHFF